MDRALRVRQIRETPFCARGRPRALLVRAQHDHDVQPAAGGVAGAVSRRTALAAAAAAAAALQHPAAPAGGAAPRACTAPPGFEGAGPGAAAPPAPATSPPAPGPQLAADKAAFVRANPQYGYSGWLDARWQAEIGCRFGPGQHYLDFTGSGLYTNSQIRAAAAELEAAAFGNPHSANPSSERAGAEVEAARARVLAHFNADPSEYVCVFTRSATDGLRIVGEALPWSPPAPAPTRGLIGGRGRAAAAATAGMQAGPALAAGGGGTAFGGGSGGGGGGPAECSPDDPVLGTCGAFTDAPPALGSGVGVGGGLGSRPVSVGGEAGGGGSTFLYLRANHKSVLGIGALARSRGARLACADEAGVDEWLASPPPQGASPTPPGVAPAYSLLAYPSMDNYEGRLYDLGWIEKAHARSTAGPRWLVALDAAAHVPTHPLDLSEVKPDFVPISFYKMFGYPTGVGALVVRREAAALLRPTYFGGGSTYDATAEDAWAIPLPAPEGLEAGTVPFLGIAALKHGFDQLDALGGVRAVEAHVESLRAWAYPRLALLSHSNGAPVLRIFGAHAAGPGAQGGIFEFLVLRPDGSAVAPSQVMAAAVASGLQLRAGCHCCPGQCLHDLGIRPEEERARSLEGYSDFITVMRPAPGGGEGLAPVRLPTGSLRASLGAYSRFEDVWALVEFLAGYRE